MSAQSSARLTQLRPCAIRNWQRSPDHTPKNQTKFKSAVFVNPIAGRYVKIMEGQVGASRARAWVLSPSLEAFAVLTEGGERTSVPGS
jgi:hypothetical protein